MSATGEVALRLIVRHPPPGVRLCVQRGRDDLVAPSAVTADACRFDVRLRVVASAARSLVLRGPEVQGPPSGRFLYVNAGTRAGQRDSCWDRRAKVPLTGVTPELLAQAVATPGAVLEGTIAGTAPDGGAACASVPLLGVGWRIAVGSV